MKDAVKNSDIEDVLSSIRRLVSDEDRVPRATRAEEPGKLVLTEAQRVVPDPVAAGSAKTAQSGDKPALFQSGRSQQGARATGGAGDVTDESSAQTGLPSALNGTRVKDPVADHKDTGSADASPLPNANPLGQRLASETLVSESHATETQTSKNQSTENLATADQPTEDRALDDRSATSPAKEEEPADLSAGPTLMQVEALARKLLAQDSEDAQQLILSEIRRALKPGEASLETATEDGHSASVEAEKETDETTLVLRSEDVAAPIAAGQPKAEPLPEADWAGSDEAAVMAEDPEAHPARADETPEPAPDATPVATDAALEDSVTPETTASQDAAFSGAAKASSEQPAAEDETPAPRLSATINEAPQVIQARAEAVESPSKAAATLEEKIAELEALLGKSDTEFDPDSADRGGNAAADFKGIPTMPWDEPRAEPAPQPEAESEAVPDAAALIAAALKAPTSERETPKAAAPDRAEVRDTAKPSPEEDTASAPVAEVAVQGGESQADSREEVGREPAPEAPVKEAPMAEMVEQEPMPRRNETGRHLHLAYSAEEPDTLDEEQLRAMVAKLIRQELQGALGERITRNVRKLVRREVQRALMDKGLD